MDLFLISPSICLTFVGFKKPWPFWRAPGGGFIATPQVLTRCWLLIQLSAELLRCILWLVEAPGRKSRQPGSHGRESFRVGRFEPKKSQKRGPWSHERYIFGSFFCWCGISLDVLFFLRFTCGSLEDVINYCLLGLKKLSGIDSWNHESMFNYICIWFCIFLFMLINESRPSPNKLERLHRTDSSYSVHFCWHRYS